MSNQLNIENEEWRETFNIDIAKISYFKTQIHLKELEIVEKCEKNMKREHKMKKINKEMEKKRKGRKGKRR